MKYEIDPELIKNDYEHQFTVHKILTEIFNKKEKIIDDWCKAYIAKEYQIGNDVHPGSFTLEQRQVNDPNQVGWDYKIVPNDQEFGVRVKWEPIETAPKDGTTILLLNSNYAREVLLGCWNESKGEFYSKDYKMNPTHWMRIPKLPEKKHFCSRGPLNLDVCKERDGKLFLTSSVFGVPPKEMEVTYCPFCGEKSDG